MFQSFCRGRKGGKVKNLDDEKSKKFFEHKFFYFQNLELSSLKMNVFS